MNRSLGERGGVLLEAADPLACVAAGFEAVGNEQFGAFVRELEVEEAVAFTVLLEERGRRLLLLSLGGTSRLEFLEGAQADSVTELGDEIRCVDAGTGCALLKNGLDRNVLLFRHSSNHPPRQSRCPS